MSSKKKDFAVQFGSADDFNSMVDMFSRMKRPIVMPTGSSWFPQVDVFETDEEFIVLLDVAHIDPKEMDITILDNILTVSGIRREFTGFNKRHYHKMEIDYGPFERKITVNVPVDERAIKTSYRDGFLLVRLRKIEDRRSGERKIEIEWTE